MPQYQAADLDALEPLRILFGFFPTYRQAWQNLPTHLYCASHALVLRLSSTACNIALPLGCSSVTRVKSTSNQCPCQEPSRHGVACVQPRCVLVPLSSLPDVGVLESPDRKLCAACPQSPLRPGWDRVLQVGDASGIQSPLSFGGFGAMTRHLKRLRDALSDALQVRDNRVIARPWVPCWI